MAKTATVVNVRVDENIKREIEALYDSLGMNISTAVNMFFRQCLIEQGLPFQPKIKRKRGTYPSLRERLKIYGGNYGIEDMGMTSGIADIKDTNE